MEEDLNSYIELIRNGKRMKEEDAIKLLTKLTDVLYQEGTVQPLPLPITVCGDIHGQLYDLFELFRVSGGITKNRYVFLGDYVDRGYHSLETFLYLAALKLKYPDHIYLLRGNHECRQINKTYGFYDECLHLYGNATLWRICNEIFDLLPISALAGNKIFCVHGGLSPEIKLIEQISLIERQDELPTSGPFTDLAWSDPSDIKSWQFNPRGAGWLYGVCPTHEFVQNNKLDLICRAHQLAMTGYQYFFGEKQLVTVWSAPNYMYRSKNDASVLKINEELEREFIIFKSVPESEKIVPPEAIPLYFV